MLIGIYVLVSFSFVFSPDSNKASTKYNIPLFNINAYVLSPLLRGLWDMTC